MKFKIGDKVNFLDEVGGGEVTAIIDSRLVKVRTKDGFEMPVLSSNLIIDQRSQPEEKKPVVVIPSNISDDKQVKEDYISDINPFRKIREVDGVYLGYEPHEQQWLLTGDIDIILANNTDYELLYSMFMINEKIEGVDFSSVPSRSKIVIETISREEIDNWRTGYIQLLLHADEPKNIYLPVHSAIDVKSQRFFKEGSYTDNTLFNGKAIVVNVAKLESIPKVTKENKELKDDSYVTTGKSTVKREKQPIDRYKTGNGEAIVDLHIGELVDNISGLSSKDMLEIQINTFNKLLNNAIKNEYTKVTFIHGVGNGVLKSAIIKDLENYDGLDNAMASIAKFGVGAIDITISTNN